ncbi:MAG TPA: alkaline phosphatase family protein [Pyrinomonadaceae bacterium]|nr:alkaline phosphatase family protein [Pyrinomonadaceae bacterium]
MSNVSTKSGKSGTPKSVASVAQKRPRRLLLCLDGVPHKLIVDAKQRGLFDAFGPPTRLLSPFPTMTNVALSAMFGASPPAGYESLYFDKRAGELRGGIKKYLGRRTPDKIPSSYMDDLDYQEPLPFEFLIYVAPERVWRADMQRFREKFRTAPQNRDYFAFLKATDGLLHAQGPERLNIALQSLDKILKEIRDYCGDETEIVMFSDHGMNLEENRRADLTTQLRRKGFRVGSRLAGIKGRAVSIPAFGLCSYAAVYCGAEEYVPETARSIAEIRGVDFVVYRDGPAVAIEGSQGKALIERRGDSYCYVNNYGDPLDLQSLSGQFMDEAVWFEKTNAHRYPDAVVNLYKSLFTARVTHTADILISLQDGYYYGWSPFGRFVRLAATHGNALQSSSNAFLMSTHRKLPECVRADNANALLRG